MVVNTLLIKLKQRDADSIAAAVSVLQKLKGQIPVLLDSRVETDIKAGTSGYDIILMNTFATAEDIPVYLSHPVHVEVGSYIAQVIDQSASLCCELAGD